MLRPTHTYSAERRTNGNGGVSLFAEMDSLSGLQI
jgi:hypothetical protein